MITLYETLQTLPAQQGDDIIKAQLDTRVADDFIELDAIIKDLRNKYPLDQIYKVYHQNFQ